MTPRLAAMGALIAAASCAAPSPSVDSRLPSENEAAVVRLVRMLHEGDIETRERTMEKLVELGPDALPALRRAQDLDGDAEVVGRLKPVIEKLEEQERLVNLVGRPRLITLDLHRRPIPEILEELERQSGVPVTGAGLRDDERADLNVRGVPLWEAVDALCRAHGGLRPEWMSDRLEIRRGAFQETPSVEWKVGPIRMGRMWIECSPYVPEKWERPGLGLTAMLLTAPGPRLYGANFFIDQADDPPASLLPPDDPPGFLSMQECNYILPPRSIRIPAQARLPLVNRLPPKEILNFRGTVYFHISPGTRRLAQIADLTPEVWKYGDKESPVSTYVNEVHRAKSDVLIKYIVTFPMMSAWNERIQGPLGVRLLTTAGHALHPIDLREQDGGGSMGASDWFYEARFTVPPEASIAGLEVLRPADPSSAIRMEFFFPRLPVQLR